MKRYLPALCTLALLAGCAPAAPPEVSESPAPVESLTPVESPTSVGSSIPVESPAPAESSAPPAEPLTEAEVKARFEAEGYLTVKKITPYEGDYLVEVSDHTAEDGWRMLYWVFGATGHQVWLNRDILAAEIDTCQIIGPGEVKVTTTGRSYYSLKQDRVRTYNIKLLVDSTGKLLNGDNGVFLYETTPHGGYLLLDQSVPVDGPIYPERYEQVYELGIGVNDLSVSFIPSGEPERFFSFFPACTSVPTTACSFEPETRRFTIRFYNTCLESGGITDEAQREFFGGHQGDYLDLYPHAVPAGDLGKGNHFIQSASIEQEGEDAVVTLTLTDRAYAYQEGGGNFGDDNFPYYRITFREKLLDDVWTG